MGKKHFCFFQTAETGNQTPNYGVKGSGADHYPRAPAHPMNNQVKISQFADDLGMWTFGPNATYVQYWIHKTLSALENGAPNGELN